MSNQQRPVPTTVTVCDLCGEVLPGKNDYEYDETGSVTRGHNGVPVETPRVKRAFLQWPPAWRQYYPRRHRYTDEEMKPKRYDFHAECILNLVEANLHTEDLEDE